MFKIQLKTIHKRRDLKILSHDNNLLSKTLNEVKTRLYLDDRRRLSPILLGIVGSFSLTIFMSYVGLHLKDINTVVMMITLILALRNIYQIFLRVPLGHFSQMIGRKPLLIAGAGFYTISLFFLAIASHWSLVIVAITFLAIGMSCFWPVIFAYISDVEESKNLGKVQGRLFQGTDLGAILGALLAFLQLKRSKITISTILPSSNMNILNIPEITYHLSQLRILFSWGAGISLFGVIGLAFFMPEVLKKEDRLQVDSKLKALGDAFVSMFRSLFIVLEYMVTAFFPFLIVAKGFSYDVVAQIAWISSGVLIFFKPYLGRLVDRFGYKGPIFVTLFLSSSMLILMVFVNSLSWLIVVYMVYSASSLTSYIGVNTGTTMESKNTQRGIALGALGFYVSLSRSASTLSLTPVWEKLGIEAVFITTSIIIFSAVIIIYLIYYFIGNRNKTKTIEVLQNSN
ncbi:MAG: MFS transporter [Candidatus Heimdallarchaeaceae archaeon]